MEKYVKLYFSVETRTLLQAIKTLIIKYGIYANIFAEKKICAAFAFAALQKPLAKATHILSAKIPVN